MIHINQYAPVIRLFYGETLKQEPVPRVTNNHKLQLLQDYFKLNSQDSQVLRFKGVYYIQFAVIENT